MLIDFPYTVKMREALFARIRDLRNQAATQEAHHRATTPMSFFNSGCPVAKDLLKRAEVLEAQMRRMGERRTGMSFIDAGLQANLKFARGEITEDQWIEELRWIGLPAVKGFTRLPAMEAAE